MYERISICLLLILYSCLLVGAQPQPHIPLVNKTYPQTILIDSVEPQVLLITTPIRITYKIANLTQTPVSGRVDLLVDGKRAATGSWSTGSIAARSSVEHTGDLPALPIGQHTISVNYLQFAPPVAVKGPSHGVWKIIDTDSQDIAVLATDPKSDVPQILGFEEQLTTSQNKAFAGSRQPDPSVCGDTVNGFLAELQLPGRLSNPRVPYEWAPIVPGPIPGAPTVQTPEFSAAGTVLRWDPGKIDVKFAHPLGWRSLSDPLAVDQSVDVWLDPAYSDLIYPRPASSFGGGFHVELEAGAWPVTDFGFTPQPGDRAAMIGNWIMDCGHPESWLHGSPVGAAEIHPPVFLAFARETSPAETFSHAFANPYRVTQLYTMHAGQNGEDWGERFDDPVLTGRYTDRLTLPFARFLYERVTDWEDLTNSKPLEIHVIIEPLKFRPFSWYVCAPPQPSTPSALEYRAHFTVRTGVSIVARKADDIGCVEFTAAMSADYRPMALQRLDYWWDWNDIDWEAARGSPQPVDVQGLITQAAAQANPAGAFGQPALDNINRNIAKTPAIDRFAPLKPIGGVADQQPDRSPALEPGEWQPGFTASDGQPFPFYGWARVFWTTLRVEQVVPVAPNATAQHQATRPFGWMKAPQQNVPVKSPPK